MLRQFWGFIVLAALVALALYITLTNSDPATIRLGGTYQITTWAGIIYISVFALGCTAASIVALFFGFKGYLRERKLRSEEKTRQAFFDLYRKARSHMAAHEWGAARQVWEQVLKRSPDNLIARVELSVCLEELGDPREALRILDITRASQQYNTELLFRAAALNEKLGNRTAALDNVSLILSTSPNKRALENARDIAEELGQVDLALEHHNELERLGFVSEESTTIRNRLTLAQILRDAPDENTLLDTLKGFCKRHSTCVPAMKKLSELYFKRGDFSDGVELLVKTAKVTQSAKDWHTVVEQWLQGDGDGKGPNERRIQGALAAARNATQSTRGVDRLTTELDVARTLLAVGHTDEAERLLAGVPLLAEREGVPLEGEIKKSYLHVKGLCLARQGLAKDSGSLWQELVQPTKTVVSSDRRTTQPGAPKPELSTP
jgi:tetratricopeptide (TPR) repeat protein